MDERRDDWRHGVDENLVSLNTAQRVTDQQIDELDLNYEAIDKVLRGDPENEKIGLIERFHAVEKDVNELKAENFRIKQSFKDDDHERWEDRRSRRKDILKSVTQIVVAAIMSGLVTHFWGAIHTFLTGKSTDPVQQIVDNAKHPKARHHHIIIRAEPEDQEDSE